MIPEKKDFPWILYISRRFAKLVKEIENLGIEQAAERILVITFTDKAAGEMKGRINSRDEIKKQKLLNRAFSCQVEDAVYDAIMEEFLSEQK